MGYQDETLSSDEQYEEFLWEQAQEELFAQYAWVDLQPAHELVS